jgi:hypothetical protein
MWERPRSRSSSSSFGLQTAVMTVAVFHAPGYVMRMCSRLFVWVAASDHPGHTYLLATAWQYPTTSSSYQHSHRLDQLPPPWFVQPSGGDVTSHEDHTVKIVPYLPPIRIECWNSSGYGACNRSRFTAT